MNIDILIYVVLLVGAVVGCWQGAFKQIASSLGVIAGLFLAMFLYSDVADWLAGMVDAEETTLQIVSFFLIVIIVPLVLGLVAKLLTGLFSLVHLNWINRIAGAAVGVVCYAFIMSVVLNVADFAISSAGTSPEKLGERTELYCQVKQISQFVVPDFMIVK